MKNLLIRFFFGMAAACLVGGGLLAQSASDKALESLMVKGWPTGKVSNTIPVFTDGVVVNSGGDSQTYYILVEKTGKKALQAYLDGLKKAGWIVTGGDFPQAEKQLVKLDFNWEGTAKLQIAVRQSRLGTWPTDLLPPHLAAPPGAQFGGEISIEETETDRMWYFTFKCLGMNEAAARDWMKSLVKQGWEGDDSQLSREFTLKGRKMQATLEIYETTGDATAFTYNYGVSED